MARLRVTVGTTVNWNEMKWNWVCNISNWCGSRHSSFIVARGFHFSSFDCCLLCASHFRGFPCRYFIAFWIQKFETHWDIDSTLGAMNEIYDVDSHARVEGKQKKKKSIKWKFNGKISVWKWEERRRKHDVRKIKQHSQLYRNHDTQNIKKGCFGVERTDAQGGEQHIYC